MRRTTAGNVECSFFVQPGGGTDLSTQLLKKWPAITVDEDGGVFLTLLMAYLPAHTLASGNDWEPVRSFSEHMVQ